MATVSKAGIGILMCFLCTLTVVQSVAVMSVDIGTEWMKIAVVSVSEFEIIHWLLNVSGI